MKTADISFFIQMLKAKMNREKRPLLVSWALTSRCNCDCFYCSEIEGKYNELKTEEVFSLIDELKSLGTKRIHFTGGEPLLREDFIKIVEKCSRKKITVSFSTNAILLKEKIQDLKGKVASININYDGPKEIYDKVKGEGKYKNLLESLRLLAEGKIKTVLTMTLRRDNTKICFIKSALELAAEYNAKIIFQPAADYTSGRGKAAEFSPDRQEYLSVIDYILKRKKTDKKKIIFSSVKTLNWLKNWPKAKGKINCPAGIISCRIKPDGHICLCGWKTSLQSVKKNFRVKDVKKEFEKLNVSSEQCCGCYCAPRIEFAYIWGLDLEVLIDMISLN